MGSITIAVIGVGDVGGSLYKIFRSVELFDTYAYDIDPSKRVHDLDDIPKPIDFIHIAIPFRNFREFIDSVESYAHSLKARAIAIHSTVAPGTTREIYKRLKTPVAYTPVRGIRRNLIKHLYLWSKWVSSLPKDGGDIFIEHFKVAGITAVNCMCEPESLELAKLWETVYRALLISAWHEIHRIALKFNADLEVIARFVGEVHDVLGDRPVYYPDIIGGHCLIPNTKILSDLYRSKLLEFILESNEMRRYEIKDHKIRKDIARIKDLWERSIRRWYYYE